MHNIENENGTLMELMQKVNDLAQRKYDISLILGRFNLLLVMRETQGLY